MMRFTCGACTRGMHEHCQGRTPPPPGMMGGSECVCKGDCAGSTAPEDALVVAAMKAVLNPGARMTRDDEVVPRVAVKTHLDGDPKPRQDEIVKWEAMRRRYAVEQMIALILLPREGQTDGPFPGFEMHSWVIRERDGKVVCERQLIEIQVTSA